LLLFTLLPYVFYYDQPIYLLLFVCITSFTAYVFLCITGLTEKNPNIYACIARQDLKAADIIVMTIIRCLAVLFTYHQFRNLQKMGSKYIFGKIIDIFRVMPILSDLLHESSVNYVISY